MAIKTVEEWQAGIIAAKDADPVIGTGGPSELSSTSLVAIWRLWTRLVAQAAADLDGYFTFHKAEVTAKISAEKPHTVKWYSTMAKAFQYGDSLPADSDVYDPVAPAGDASLIVSNAAAVELANMIRLKVRKSSGALSGGELTAFRDYIARIKDAGVRMQCTSGAADNLQLKLTIWYDALVLDATGARLDGTSATPVKDAIAVFLADKVPFNGLFVLNRLIQYIEDNVEGVRIMEVDLAQANYAATPYVTILSDYNPDAGYMELDTTYFDAHVGYNPHGPIE